MKRCKSNHLIYNESINDKIAHLLSLDEKQRPFVASKMYKENASFILNQILYRKKAVLKLPTFVKNNCIFTEKSLAQATSETIAQLKADLICQRNLPILSLTGGLGVDDYFFAKIAKNVISIDTDNDLNELVRFNFCQLGTKNIERFTQDCIDYLAENSPKDSIIYLDPDRRAAEKSKSKVTQYSPNIFEILPPLLANNNKVFIKLAGTIDITWIKLNIPQVSNIYILSHKNEVKELLIQCMPTISETIEITSLEIDNNDEIHYFHSLQEISMLINEKKGCYLFQPYSCISKQGILNQIALPISANTNIFYSDKPLIKKYGKVFKIAIDTICGFKEIEHILAENNFLSTAITARNTSLNSAAIVKKLKLKEDDKKHVFLFAEGKKYHVILCEIV